MIWPLSWVVTFGTLPGVIIGARVRIEYLSNPNNFKFFVGFVSLYIRWRLLTDAVKSSGQVSMPLIFLKILIRLIVG